MVVAMIVWMTVPMAMCSFTMVALLIVMVVVFIWGVRNLLYRRHIWQEHQFPGMLVIPMNHWLRFIIAIRPRLIVFFILRHYMKHGLSHNIFKILLYKFPLFIFIVNFDIWNICS